MRTTKVLWIATCACVILGFLAFADVDCLNEDFSQETGLWTEYDPNGKIQLDYATDQRLEFNNWIRYNPGCVSRPYSTQDFVLDFDIRITASGGNAKVIGPGLSDTLDTIDQIQNGIHVVYYAGFPTVSPRLSINTRVDGATEWGYGGNPPQPNRINISKNVTYYVRLEKSGSTLTLSVFSDPARTIHISGSPKAVTTTLSGTTFNCFYAVNGYTTSPVGNWEWTTGWIDNISVCDGPPATADEDTIVFASDRSGNYDIWRVNMDGSGLYQLTSSPAREDHPHWSGDGTKIAYTNWDEGIHIMNPDGTGDTLVPNTVPRSGATGPDCVEDWGPSNKILFSTENPDGVGAVYGINPDGRGRRMLTDGNDGDHPQAGWSPDCNEFVFEDGTPGIGGAKVSASPVSTFTPREIFPRSSVPLEWSPDGQWVLVWYASVLELWKVKPDGSGASRILAAGTANRGTIASDSDHLIYSAAGDLWITDLSGTGPAQLTSGPSIDDYPDALILAQCPPPVEQKVLTVTKAGTGNGTVTSAPPGINCGSDCDESYAIGTDVALTAEENPDSVFREWSGCSTCLSGDRSITYHVSSDCELFPVFSSVCAYDTTTRLHKPGVRRALIVAPFYHSPINYRLIEYSEDLEARLLDMGWEVEYHGRDDDVTIPAFEEWLNDDYGIIHITTHGGANGEHFAVRAFDNDEDGRDQTFDELRKGKYCNSIVSGHSDEAGYYIGVEENFIYDFCSTKSKPLIYLESCYNGRDTDLAALLREAFLCKGAGAFVGFDGLVGVRQHGLFRTAKEVSSDFYNYLFEGFTVKQAVDHANENPADDGRCEVPFMCDKVYLRSYGKREHLILEDFTIYALTDLVESMNLPVGIENSLVSKLEGALTSLEKGNAKTAVNKLNAFINEVEAQRGKKITEREADQLIDGANRIIESIDGAPVAPTQARTSIAIEVFPNPVRDVNTATFRVMGEAADLVEVIKVQIFDLSGRLVYETEKTGTSLDWCTINNAGEYLANGIYLYKIYALIDGSWVESEVKKLAILR